MKKAKRIHFYLILKMKWGVYWKVDWEHSICYYFCIFLVTSGAEMTQSTCKPSSKNSKNFNAVCVRWSVSRHSLKMSCSCSLVSRNLWWFIDWQVLVRMQAPFITVWHQSACPGHTWHWGGDARKRGHQRPENWEEKMSVRRGNH